MAYGLNKVQIIGNVGRDPELRMTQSGVPVATFSVATNESYKGQDGNLVDRTEWHNVVAWRRLAEILAEYLKKGSKVYIEGKLQTRNYEKEGQTHYRTEIVVDEFVFLDSRGSGGDSGPSAPPPQQDAPPDTDQSGDDDLPF
ncbi:MAG: single-stranded DNA-binding protein [Ectothiorhodospiraceae bacterium]|nr:single-stranded DNA-binding protein [Ectothiorhodospiraceae bacterium]